MESIDLFKLYAQGSHVGWNEFLTDCLNKQDINRLCKMMRAIQHGADDLAKKKLNDEKMNLFYIRLLKSIEMTVRKIIRIKHPNPRDNPMFKNNPALAEAKWIEVKCKRDQELEMMLRKASY